MPVTAIDKWLLTSGVSRKYGLTCVLVLSVVMVEFSVFLRAVLVSIAFESSPYLLV